MQHADSKTAFELPLVYQRGVVMDFPQRISFTITNVCNLRCRMCGQWSEEGYMHNRKENLKQEMDLAD